MKASVLLSVLLVIAIAQAEVDLEWRVEGGPYQVGETVRVGFYAVADNRGQNEPFCAMQVIVLWDADFLCLEGIDNNGPYPWASSGFPDDSGLDGLNSSFKDGNAYYHAWANFGNPAVSTPEGLLVTTFLFEARAATAQTEIRIPATYGQYSVTAVLDEQIPGLNIVGDLGSVNVPVLPSQWKLGDMNCDGLVDFADIDPFVLAVGGQAGYAAKYPNCRWLNGDIDGDGDVDFDDIDPFVALLGG